MPTRYFFRATQTEPTTGGDIYDLSETQGSDDPLGSQGNESNDFLTTVRWRLFLDGIDIVGDIPTSLMATAIQGNTEYRWRVNRLDGNGDIAESSDWSAVHDSTGVQTETLTAPNSEPYEFLEIEFQSRRAGGKPDNNSVTIAVSDADSYIDAELSAGTTGVTAEATVGTADAQGLNADVDAGVEETAWQSHVASLNPVTWFRFAETSGTDLADEQGASDDGSLVGGDLDVSFPLDAIVGGVHLDGNNTGANLGLRFLEEISNSNDMTWVLLLQPHSTAQQTVLQLDGLGAIAMIENGTLGWFIQSGHDGSTTLVADETRMHVFVINDGTVTTYEASGTTASQIDTGSDSVPGVTPLDLLLGVGHASGYADLNATVGVFFALDYPLSAQQVDDLAATAWATQTVPVTAEATIGEATSTGLDAEVSAGQAITADASVGEATSHGLDAEVSAGQAITVEVTVGIASAEGLDAEVLAGQAVIVEATVGQATAEGLDAEVIANISFIADATLGTATAEGLDAEVVASTAFTAEATVGTATATGLDADVASGKAVTVQTTVGEATADGLDAEVTAQASITADATVGEATATGLEAEVSAGQSVVAEATTGTATADGLEAEVLAGQGVTAEATTGIAEADGLDAEVISATAVTIDATVGTATAEGLNAQVSALSKDYGNWSEPLTFFITTATSEVEVWELTDSNKVSDAVSESVILVQEISEHTKIGSFTSESIVTVEDNSEYTKTAVIISDIDVVVLDDSVSEKSISIQSSSNIEIISVSTLERQQDWIAEAIVTVTGQPEATRRQEFTASSTVIVADDTEFEVLDGVTIDEGYVVAKVATKAPLLEVNTDTPILELDTEGIDLVCTTQAPELLIESVLISPVEIGTQEPELRVDTHSPDLDVHTTLPAREIVTETPTLELETVSLELQLETLSPELRADTFDIDTLIVTKDAELEVETIDPDKEVTTEFLA